MPYRCYELHEQRVDFNTPHPTTGRKRTMQGGSPPGQLLNAREAVLTGWCRISPTYRDLPADASPAVRSKAREVFARLCYRHQLEVHDVEGGRFAFRVEALYDDSQPQDRWYYGIGVYQRTDPRAEDPFSLATWDSIPGAPYEQIPQGVARAELAAYARSKGIPCVTKATGSALPSSYPSWVIGLGLASVVGGVYFLTRQKPSTFKSNSAKRNGKLMPMTPAQRDAILHNKKLTKSTRAMYATGAWSMSALAAELRAWSARKERGYRMSATEAFDLVDAILGDADWGAELAAIRMEPKVTARR